jgi:hypothetical protein
VANARSTGSCTLLRKITPIAASTIAPTQATKNAFTTAPYLLLGLRQQSI